MKKKKTSVIIAVCLLALFAVGGVFVSRKLEKANYPRDYSEFVSKYCNEYDVPESLVYAVIRTESDFRADAKSKAGAVGLMQLMPDTYDWLSRLIGEEAPPEKIAEPEQNIKYGTYYLRHLYDRFGSWNTAIAGYNAGHGRVGNWLKDSRYSDDGVELKAIPLSETSNYVKKVTDAKTKYEKLYY